MDMPEALCRLLPRRVHEDGPDAPLRPGREGRRQRHGRVRQPRDGGDTPGGDRGCIEAAVSVSLRRRLTP